jgi:UDP-N-acetylglucosamine 1-carboxyvinyltransferase
MDKIVVEGGKKLFGEISISGAKNSALPIIAATLLTDEESVIENVPPLRDVYSMLKLLKALGARVTYDEQTIRIKPSRGLKHIASYKMVSTMRASFCVLGPLIARLGKAEVSLPGGCVIGPRPIDLHLKGLQGLGVKVKIEGGYVKASAAKLKGNDIFLGGAFGSSVLATGNVMMAATLAQGTTFIENAACEPEVVDLAHFLIKMGARIEGAGTHLIKITGVKKLHGVRHRVIPDRIEAGTYMIAAAMVGGNIHIKDALPEHNGVLIDKLKQIGVIVRKHKNSVSVIKRTKKLLPVNITTMPYPGFPTDLQAQMMALMTIMPGISVITEKVYPERFMHISELNRMGANIFLEGSSAIINGAKRLSGAPVMASDLRASAALVIAGLVAEGRSDIHRVYHLDRGYYKIEEKLQGVGANIWREKE